MLDFIIDLLIVSCVNILSKITGIFVCSKMIATKRILLLTLAMCLARQEIIADENADAILGYITKKDEPIREVTFILGPVGSGKTTLALLLIGEKLNPERDQDSKLLIITDDNHKIGNGSKVAPRTVVPELMHDSINKHYYYDCTGFSDSKKVNEDIETTLLFKKLFNSAEKFSFIFTIAYDSMESDIKTIIESMSTFNKEIDVRHIRTTTLLVVTKAPNNEFYDDIYKLYRNNFIQVRANMANENFTEILSDEYSPILIFRRPSSLVKAEFEVSLGKERNQISSMLLDHLFVITRKDVKFTFSLSSQPKEKINENIDNILNKIVDNFKSIVEGINDFIMQEESRCVKSLDESIKMMKNINETLSQIDSDEPLQFKEQLLNMIYGLGIKISGDSMLKSLQYIEFIDKLRKFTQLERRFTVPEKISNDLANVKKSVAFSLDWYEFLTSLRQSLDNVGAHQYKHHSSNFNASSYSAFLMNDMNSISSDSKLKIQNAIKDEEKSSTYKIQLFHAILKQSLEDPDIDCDEKNKHLIVRGYNIYMESVLRNECFKTAPHVFIFAINKVLIDVNVEVPKRPLDMSIISPSWDYTKGSIWQKDILGQKNEYNRFIGIGQSLPYDGKMSPESTHILPDYLSGIFIYSFFNLKFFHTKLNKIELN